MCGRTFTLVLFCVSMAKMTCESRVNVAKQGLPIIVSTESSPTTTDDPVRPNFKHLEQILKNVTRVVVKKALPSMMKLMGNVNVSSNCVNSLLKYASSLKQIKVWAVRMFDASAKIPSGVFDGTVTEFGAFDQCLKIRVRHRKGNTEHFRGQYCSLEARPNLGPRPANLSLAVRPNTAFDDSIMKEIYTTIFAFYQLTLRFGICVPSTCSLEDMQQLGVEVAKTLQHGITIGKCHVSQEIQVDTIHVAILCVVCILILLLVAGTIMDISSNEEKEEKIKSTGLTSTIVMCFSVPANFRKLVSMETTNGEMRSLHGIRALSMTWVILGHTYIWINFQTLRKSSKASEWFNNIEFEVILNGWLCVASFIFLSGLLTAHTTLNYMNKTKGRMNIFFYIVRRFLRLYPSLLLVLGSIFFLPWIATGPFWPELPGIEVDNCRRYWWTNLLFINNWRPINQMCMQHSWYISADLQLHVIALLVLIPLHRNIWAGLCTGGMLSVGGILTVGVITYINDYDPTILISTGNVGQLYQIAEDIHIKTFTYFGPYCIGIGIGYLLLKYPKIKLGTLPLLVGWCTAVMLSVSSLYGIHRWNTGDFPGPLVTATYAAFHRSTFVLGLGWVAFVCVSGNAGALSVILSSRPLVLASRLTFMAYLAQGPVIWTRYGSLKERLFYSHFTMFYEYIGNLFLSLMLAFGGHILVEAPFANLERLIFSNVRNTEVKAEVKSNSDLTHVNTTEDSKMYKSQDVHVFHNKTMPNQSSWKT